MPIRPIEHAHFNCFFVLRFYFRNWHGLNENEPTVSRYAVRSGTHQGGSPLLDLMSLEYLFSQVCIEQLWFVYFMQVLHSLLSKYYSNNTLCLLCLQKAKYEFVNEVVQMEDVQSEEELNRFKNESLGMAVLHLSHQAVHTGSSLQEVAEKIR